MDSAHVCIDVDMLFKAYSTHSYAFKSEIIPNENIVKVFYLSFLLY